MSTIAMEVELAMVVCSACGVPFAFPENIVHQRRRDHQTFYCPAGHTQYFPGESDIERLKRELKASKEAQREIYEWGEQQKTERQAVERRLRGTRAALTRTKNKLAAGHCPLCDVAFPALHEHMSSAHPDYQQQDEPEANGEE